MILWDGIKFGEGGGGGVLKGQKAGKMDLMDLGDVYLCVSIYDVDEMCTRSMKCKLSRIIPMWTFQFKLLQMVAIFLPKCEHRNLLCPPPWHSHYTQHWYPTDSSVFLLQNCEQTLRHCHISPITQGLLMPVSVPCITDWRSNVVYFFPLTNGEVT